MYVDGAAFRGGISTLNSSEAKIAYQDGRRVIYSIITRKSIALDQNDLVKRKSDGQVFRITSAARDMSTPNKAREQFYQVTAEAVRV